MQGIARLLFFVLALQVAEVPSAGQAGTQGSRPEGLNKWVPRSRLRVWHRIGNDLAKLGCEEEVFGLGEVLERLGETEETLERVREGWTKHMAQEGGSFRRAAALVTRMDKEIGRLGKSLEKMPADVRKHVAETMLLLDAQDALANGALGHVQDSSGLWVSPDIGTLELGRRRLESYVQEVQALELDIESGPSPLPAVAHLYGGEGRRASGYGVVVHGAQGEQKLRRILRGIVQGLALSNALRTGRVAVPELPYPREFLLLESYERFEEAQTEAVENLGLSFSDIQDIADNHQLSYHDKRGWRTSTWRTEADFQSFCLWVLLTDVLSDGVQPCLAAGHINWVALSLYGTTLPNVGWRDPTAGERTLTAGMRIDGRSAFRSARRSLFGCRSWMIDKARRGEDPPWWKAMVDQVGKIQNDVLFKATLVHEYLACSGPLENLIEETRADDERVQAFEAALKLELPRFEEEWSRWLLGARDGIVQRLQQLSQSEKETAAKKLISKLNELREIAFQGKSVEFVEVFEAPDLSAGARAHARYLRANEEQKYLWPEVHEEFIDRPGYSAEGSRAGLSSVIAFTPAPESALREWMGTFYHRLPLLDPSLFGVGFAVEERIAVLDCLTLRAPLDRNHWIAWPPDGLSNVPTAFVPESPNPVPERLQRELGYPVTLQFFPAYGRGDPDVKLRLEAEGGDPVDCHFLTPEFALFEEHVPDNAWCLIPERHLKSGTRYTVHAEIDGRKSQWSFRTAR